ncbi:AI-2E family transporter [Paenibacillus abyssi]|uniref:AI-2E family transporter n=1 Tax=Paenibacillus abyssi TaxID=1340531 RepID=A0A917FL96_9BACL|nr:AI-2E family transporter [Paenibacillus abyssi]GGF89432.1 AI-2E family transporter [Paenibacillus abyssi]
MQIGGRFYQAAINIILVLIMIYLASKIDFVFRPFRLAFDIVVMPVIFSVFFYYILRPFVSKLHHLKMNKALAILLLYALMAGLFILFLFLVWPTLKSQITSFVESLPLLATDFQNQLQQLQNSEIVQGVDINESSLMNKLTDYLSDVINSASEYVSGAVSFITTFIIVISTVPILLYYMLKQDKEAYRKILHTFPPRLRSETRDTLLQIDKILSEFILGRVVLCVLLGIMVYIGFLIIDLPYSLMLALIVAFFNLIPYIGQILAMIPCLIVAFIDSPSSVIWVILIIMIAQQIEGNLLSPHIYGRKLDIHPVVTILLILIAGTISGIIGIMVAIPVYLIAKVILAKLYHHFIEPKISEHSP